MARHPNAAGSLLFGLAAGAAFSLVLSGRCFYFGDFQAAFEPLRAIVARAWREGLPLWSPALANGMPLLASPFAGVLYPPNLVLALAPAETGRLLSILVVLHVVFGGWGAARLARRLGQGVAGGTAAALAFSLSGATVSGTYMVVLVCTAMWLPWLVLACLGVREERRRAFLALGAVLGMMLLAADPAMILAGSIGVACLLVRGDLAPGKVGRVAAGLAVGLLLASPALLAIRRYFPATVRAAGLNPAERVSRSLHPLEAVGFLVPDAYGSRVLAGPDGGILYPGQKDGNGPPLFPGLYVGASALALGFVGAVRGPARTRLVAWFALLVLLALGRYGPFAFVSDLPALAALRFPSKWILAAGLPLALLVGGGVSALEGDRAPANRRLLAGSLACALIVLAAVAAGANLGLGRFLAGASVPAGSGRPLQEVAESIRIRLLEGAARGAVPALVALGVVRAAGSAGGAPWMVSLLLALDLVAANRSLAPTAPARFYEATPAAVRVIREDPRGHARVWVDQSMAARAVLARAPSDPAALDAALVGRRERLDAYTTAAYGLPLAFHVDLEALGTSRYALLTSLAYSVPLRARVSLLGAAGVSHLVSPTALADERLDEIASVDVGSDQPLRVYRNRALLPRARLVKAVVPVRRGFDAEVLARVDDAFFGGRTIVDADDLPRVAAAWKAAGIEAPGGDVRLVEDSSARVSLRTSGGGGFLVLSDSFAPGWRAGIDGRAATIFPADVAFRMVVVPPGSHEVVFDYSPWRP